MTHTSHDIPRLEKKYPEREILLIPGEMAFGTGEHVTTASCLRLLCDVAEDRRGMPWSMFDLGTGTGILAIAARRLGAVEAEALDSDPDAVRVANGNARRNRISALRIAEADILCWKPARPRQVVCANMFSEVLIRAAPRIGKACRSGGSLVLSGILRSQEDETLAAFRSRRFQATRIVRRGKWIAARMRKSTGS